MQCIKCGQDLPDIAAFCMVCGTPQKALVKAPQAEVMKPPATIKPIQSPVRNVRIIEVTEASNVRRESQQENLVVATGVQDIIPILAATIEDSETEGILVILLGSAHSQRPMYFNYNSYPIEKEHSGGVFVSSAPVKGRTMWIAQKTIKAGLYWFEQPLQPRREYIYITPGVLTVFDWYAAP